MRSGRIIQKSFAIILLLVFAQKSGVELYLHNWLHAGNYKQSLPNAPRKNVVSYSCNCIDDFSMPFAESTPEIGSSTAIPHQIFYSLYIRSDSFSFLLFNSLRAPPAIIA
ncbi:MAG: hypothetical protein ACHQF0_15905 [Chitinophagales bacterium]